MNKKTNIIVTGGMGFIGFEIAKKYKEAGYNVFIIDNCSNLKDKKNPKGLNFISCDLRNIQEVSSLINSIKPTIISHHAAHIDVGNSIKNPIFDAESNVISTLNILSCLEKNPIKKFIFSSSGGAVYDSSQEEPFSEHTPLKPANPYGIGKMTCENYIRFFAEKYGYQSIILRYSNVYGIGQIHNKYQGVIIKFLQKFLDDEIIEINGDGTQTRDFIYIDDVVQANMIALKYKYGSEVFNIGSGEKTSILEIVTLLSHSLKKTPNIQLKSGHPGVTSSLLDITSAKKKLGFNPTFSVKQGIKNLIKDYKMEEISSK